LVSSSEGAIDDIIKKGEETGTLSEAEAGDCIREEMKLDQIGF